MAVAGDLIASLGQKVDEITETDVLILDKEGLLKELSKTSWPARCARPLC